MTKKPSHVRDNPTVKDAHKQRDDLQQQLTGIREKIAQLAKTDSVDQDAMALVNSGGAVTAVLPSTELATFRRQERVLSRSIEMHQQRTTAAENEAAAEIRSGLQPQLNERLLSLADACGQVERATKVLGGLLQQAAALGASFPPEKWVPLLGDPFQKNVLRLPQPLIAARAWRLHLLWAKKHLPQLADGIDKAIEGLSK